MLDEKYRRIIIVLHQEISAREFRYNHLHKYHVHVDIIK